MSKGREITFYEREKIETWLRMKKKKIWIAKKLNKNYSIIKRNKRDSIEHNAKNAQYYSQRRKSKTNIRRLNKLN